MELFHRRRHLKTCTAQGGSILKVLAYIGARGNSRRLRRKNLQKYGETTLMEHAIVNALRSEYVDEVIFDSEDEEMLSIAKKYDVIVHKRDPSLSGDDVSLYLPVKKVLREYPAFDIVVILQVDNPVKNHEIIDRCVACFIEHDDADDVSTFHDNRRTGTVRVVRREAFFNLIPTANIYGVEDRADFVDIHTEEDLRRANEFLKNPHHDTFQVKNKIKEPVDYNTAMIYNHFRRYILAIDRLGIKQNDVVVDASCGQGYGTYLLSKHASLVYGLDINRDHLIKAREFYGNKSIIFSAYDEKPSISADKIVCIETIEHIPKDELIPFRATLLSYLKKHGAMFITTPIGNDGSNEYNKYHLNEMSFETLMKTFSPYFKKISVEIDHFVDSYGKKMKYCMACLEEYDGDDVQA